MFVDEFHLKIFRQQFQFFSHKRQSLLKKRTRRIIEIFYIADEKFASTSFYGSLFEHWAMPFCFIACALFIFVWRIKFSTQIILALDNRLKCEHLSKEWDCDKENTSDFHFNLIVRKYFPLRSNWNNSSATEFYAAYDMSWDLIFPFSIFHQNMMQLKITQHLCYLLCMNKNNFCNEKKYLINMITTSCETFFAAIMKSTLHTQVKKLNQKVSLYFIFSREVLFEDFFKIFLTWSRKLIAGAIFVFLPN